MRQFAANNHAPFHLWRKKKYGKIPKSLKYYCHDCSWDWEFGHLVPCVDKFLRVWHSWFHEFLCFFKKNWSQKLLATVYLQNKWIFESSSTIFKIEFDWFKNYIFSNICIFKLYCHLCQQFSKCTFWITLLVRKRRFQGNKWISWQLQVAK